MRTHSAAGVAATSHDEMKLVDEEDDTDAFLALLLDLAQDGLDSLLVLALVLCACHQRAHVQAKQPTKQRRRYISLDDPLRQSLRDRRLAHTGFTNKDRVVLRPSTQDPHSAADLVVASDDGVELALFGERGEVDCVFGESIEALFGVFAVDTAVASGLLEGGFDGCGSEGGFFENGRDR